MPFVHGEAAPDNTGDGLSDFLAVRIESPYGLEGRVKISTSGMTSQKSLG